MSQSETTGMDAACESPRDCKHGRLARSCEICELERDSELLHKGGVIEIAVRNPSVSGYMSHWEGRATAAESSLTSCREALERVTAEKDERRHSLAQEIRGVLKARGYWPGLPDDDSTTINAVGKALEAAERRAEAMEKALQRIEDHFDMTGYGPDAWKNLALEMAEVARAALKESSNG